MHVIIQQLPTPRYSEHIQQAYFTEKNWMLPGSNLWYRWKTGTLIVLLELSPPVEEPDTLSAITLPRLEGGRGGVDDTALFDWDFKPVTEN